MSDTQMTADSGSNMPYFTVAELSGAIKKTIEGQFEFVRVRGEISRPSTPASGHIYFTLKDAQISLSAVVWKGMAASMTVRPEEGLDVICTGKITTFGGQSKYQIIVNQIEVAGEGALLKQLEDRRKKLAAEGLFDQERKQAIPKLPRRIGVVTSPSGAVIRDILHRLSERFGTEVLVWGVPVQGQGAEKQIAAAIAGFNSLSEDGPVARPDLLIVARGGGSLEDLWCFNEELVARAVADSTIPVISAVGHETDTTLIDYVADLRAPTPTAAAELATPVARELKTRLLELEARLSGAISRRFDTAETLLRGAGRGLLHPAELIGRQTQHLDMLSSHLHTKMERQIGDRQLKIARLAERLPAPSARLSQISDRLSGASVRIEGLMSQKLSTLSQTLVGLDRLLQANSFERVLDRGFALVTSSEGKAVKRSAELATGAEVHIRFADAVRAAKLDGVATGGGTDGAQDKLSPRSKPARKSTAKQTPSTEQTELF